MHRGEEHFTRETKEDAPRVQRPIGIGRIEGLELGRIVAALGVVWIHSPDEATQLTLCARWAVPFFVAVSACLATFARPPSFPIWLMLRLRRIYLPFLVWNLVYLMVRWAPRAFSRRPVFDLSIRELLFDGYIHHLWFLPFIMFVGVVAQGASRLKLPKAPLVVALVVSALVAAAFPRHSVVPPSFGYFAGLAWDNVPAALAGTALGVECGSLFALKGLCRKYWGWGWALFVVGAVVPMIHGERTVALEGLAGVGAVVVFVGLGDKAVPDIARRMARYAFGIYILHVLFVEGLQDVLLAVGIHLSHYPNMIVSFGVGVASSIGTTNLLHRNKITKELIP